MTECRGEAGGDEREMDFWEAVSPSSLSAPLRSLDEALVCSGFNFNELNVGGDGGGSMDDDEEDMENVMNVEEGMSLPWA